MRLFRRRDPLPIVAENAVPPTYHGGFTPGGGAFSPLHRTGFDGWFEPLLPIGGVGTVERCLQLNAQSIASMPLNYKHAAEAYDRDPAWRTDPDPAWYPNGMVDAMYAVVRSIYARGEAFLWVTGRYDNGYPRTWTVLDAATMHVEDADGVRSYRSNGYWLRGEDVAHIMRDPTGALRGTPALEAYWANVQSAYQAETYAADVYQSTGVNRVALRSARRLEAAQAMDVQAQWVAAVSRRLGAPAIIPPDLELLETLSISPKDMMLLESREWDAKQIAAAFGVPAMLLNIAVSGGLTYQNPSQLFALWWRTELMPTATKISEALSRWLPRGHWVEFDPGAQLRPDLETLVRIYSQALKDGAITVDEYRATVFDLPPFTQDDDRGSELFEAPGAHKTPEGVIP